MPHDSDWWEQIWADAISAARAETGLDCLPETCRWSQADIFDLQWLPTPSIPRTWHALLMKIDRSNPRHWRYLLQSGLYTLLAIPIRYLFKRRSQRPLVVLYGHKLNGNLLALYRYCGENPQPRETRFLTLDPDYARERSDLKPLLALRLRDMIRVAMADCIVTDHGLHAMFPLLYLTNIRFADVWHGVPFKGFVPANFRVQHHYDQIWVSSPAIRDLWCERFGFDPNRVVVTGYGRTDTLLHYYAQRDQLRARYEIPLNRRTILFAPTWTHGDTGRSESPFGDSLEAFVERLAKFAAQQDAVVLIRHHLNSANGQSEWRTAHVRAVPASDYPDAEEILAISDCLVTDWSSIAFDFMAIEKPIVFLDVPAPFEHGFSLPSDCRAGAVVRDIPALEAALVRSLGQPHADLGTSVEKYARVRQIAFGDTLDGDSAKRYARQLEDLLTRS